MSATIAVLSQRPSPAVAAERELLLAVELNQRPLETVVQVTEHDGTLLLQRADFVTLGLVAPQHQGSSPAPFAVPLNAVPGVVFRIDEARQMLLITAQDDAMLPQVLRAGPAARPPDAAGFGALVNYDLFATAGSRHSFAGLFETRVSTPKGSLSSGFLVQSPYGTRFARLATTFIHPQYDQNRVWQFGDVISGGLSWTRPYRLAGAQVQTIFSMRPDLVTYPVPSLSGRTAVPSSVDVLVNGVRQFSEPVQGGPFTIRQPPVVTGAGEITLVTRDALGQASQQTVPFYISPSMLAEGLSSYSLETGLVRTGYGQGRDIYRTPAASLSARRGLADWLTGEIHGEATAAVQMGGIGIALRAAPWGVMTMSAAASTASLPRRTSGWQYAIGAERAGSVLSAAAVLTGATPGFRDVPALVGDPVPRQQLRLSLGLNLASFGAIRTAFVATTGGLLAVYRDNRRSSLAIGNARLGSVSYTRPLGERASIYASLYRDFSRNGAAGLIFGVNFAFGTNRSAGVSASVARGRLSQAVDAVQAAILPGEYGLRAHVDTDRNASQFAELTHISQSMTTRAGLERLGRQNTASGEIQGALALADGQVFAANRVADSYAVIDAGGEADVPVSLENRLVGRTDSAGRLLVPDLRSWGDNHISLDPTQLPADAETEDLSRIVRPPDRSGVVVAFPIRRGRSAVIRLIDGSGRPIPVGVQAVLQRTGRRMVVGYDGEVFASGLEGEESLIVEAGGPACLARFHFAPRPGEIPAIGPVPCKASTGTLP